jgi:hypothetical protein
MLDSLIEPKNDNTTSAALETDCPACGIPFIPGRKNQEYCSRCCQKNASRGFRHLENFTRDAHEAARAKDLRETLYAAPPSERLGVMKDILDAAYHDGSLRNILTRPELLADRPFSAGRGQTNIAKAADDYCRKFLRMSVRDYIRRVRSLTGDKPTGEPLDVNIEVVRDRSDHGPVPKLNQLTMQNVKCIHKVLPEGDHGTAQADLDRVDRICEVVEARMAARGPADVPEQPNMEQPSVQHGNQPSDKREAKRKIALSQVCFHKGVNIDSHLGKALASSMGIQTL